MSNSKPPFPPNAFLILNGADIIPLEKEYINIGRMDDNDIIIPNAHISRYHAQIRGIEGKYVLVDLQSTSGTSINGNQVTSKILAPGDVILIAGVPLIYGETTNTDRFKANVSDKLSQSSQENLKLGNTEEVDLSTLDSLLDVIDISDDPPASQDEHTEK